MKQTSYNLLARSHTAVGNLTLTDFKAASTRKLIVLSHGLQQGELYDNINRQIAHNIDKFELIKVHSDVLEKNLQELFIRLNWQIFSLFSEEKPLEKGISLSLVLIDENNIFAVQFGRILLGLKKKKKFLQIGSSWDNFRVKTREELNLLGSRDEEISVRILHPELEIGDQLLALPSLVADKLDRSELIGDPQAVLEKTYSESSFPYFVIGREVVRSESPGLLKRLFRKK